MAVTYDVTTPERDLVAVSGSFTYLDGAGTPSSSGSGFTATREDTGKYYITFDTPWPTMQSCICTLQLNALDDKYVIPKSYTSSTGVLELYVYDISGGAAADAGAAHANTRINFTAYFLNRT